jgi:hypothetical protein
MQVFMDVLTVTAVRQLNVCVDLKILFLVSCWSFLFCTVEVWNSLLSLVTSHHLFYVHGLLLSFYLWLSVARLEVLTVVSWQMEVFGL